MGIDYVVSRAEETGRKSIISMSLGGIGMSPMMDYVIEKAFEAGVLVVGEYIVLYRIVFVQHEMKILFNDSHTHSRRCSFHLESRRWQ